MTHKQDVLIIICEENRESRRIHVEKFYAFRNDMESLLTLLKTFDSEAIFRGKQPSIQVNASVRYACE